MEIQIKDLENCASSNFDKRCLCLDFNKTGFDYLFKKKADYLLVDILDSRMPMAKKGDHYISEAAAFVKNRDMLNSVFDVCNYTDVDPFEEITKEQWDRAIEKICDKLLYHYSPSQIIINRHFMCEKFYGDNYMASFPDIKTEDIDYLNPAAFYNSAQGIRKTNKLAADLFEALLSAVPGCHVIEFPENIIADGKHRWGLSALHYSPVYYEYGSEAVKIICSGYSQEKEKSELSRLREIYSDKAALQLKNLDISEMNKQLFWVRNALNFARDLAVDQFENDTFNSWLKKCAAEHNKIAVLKVNDIAGQILLKALSKYNIEVIFTSFHGVFEPLTDKEIELCQAADIIICADVHGTAPVTYNDLTAIRILDLLK
ncbi:MAG: hypothetical protein J1E62_10250 [Lachnospiraceae bacterium]|nr:hypothetical protein [Lachnospiraceae bacterium]